MSDAPKQTQATVELLPRFAWMALGCNESGYFQHIIRVKRPRLGWCLLQSDCERTAEMLKPDAEMYRKATGHEVRLVRLTPTTLRALA